MKVEVGQYREVNKGTWKATFSLVIHPEGQKILDCRYFEQGASRWFAFPSKRIERQGSDRPEYIPLVSYLNKEYLEQLRGAVLEALKDVKHDAKEASKSNTKQENQVHSDAQALWF